MTDLLPAVRAIGLGQLAMWIALLGLMLEVRALRRAVRGPK